MLYYDITCYDMIQHHHIVNYASSAAAAAWIFAAISSVLADPSGCSACARACAYIIQFSLVQYSMSY